MKTLGYRLLYWQQCHHTRIEVLVMLALLLWVAIAQCQPTPVYAEGGGTVTTADAGIVQPLTPATPGACLFSPGWNLVALSGFPSDLPACVNAAWGWDGDTWQFWGRANPVYWNDLKSFDIRKGYWLWVTP